MTIYSPSGVVDTGGPVTDADHNDCRWLIKSPESTAVILNFPDVHLKGDQGRVSIFVGPENVNLYKNEDVISWSSAFKSFTGDTFPTPIVCPSSEVLVVFKTDAANAAKSSLTMTWSSVGVKVNGQPPPPPPALPPPPPVAKSALLNAGMDCWDRCQSKQGPCSFCGTGMCCRKGWKDTSNGCDGTLGGEGKHVCVSKQVTSKKVTRKFSRAVLKDAHFPAKKERLLSISNTQQLAAALSAHKNFPAHSAVSTKVCVYEIANTHATQRHQRHTSTQVYTRNTCI